MDCIHFASDSRATYFDGSFIDTVIKVMDIGVRINTPVDENGACEMVYNHTLGLCFSGSTQSSFLIKEHISESLKHLQYLPGYTELSLRNICQTIGKFFKTVAEDIKRGYDLDPDTVFLIAGYCPLLCKIAVYRLELVKEDVEGLYTLMVDDVLDDPEEIIYLGSGGERAREMIESGNLTGTHSLFCALSGNSGETDQPKPEQTDHLKGWRRLPNFAGEDFQFSADLV